MSHAEYVDWAAFAEIEPLPAMRGDIQTAMLLLMLYTINKGKKGRKLKLTDLVPDWWNDKRSPRSLERKFRALTAHLDQPQEPDEADGGRTGIASRQAGTRR